MKCSLGISDFLEEISSLSHSIVFPCFFALITEEGFLSLLAIVWNSAFKWDLGSITMNKASEGDGIPAELFQIPKDDAAQVLLNMSANLENSAVATGLEKVSFHSNP